MRTFILITLSIIFSSCGNSRYEYYLKSYSKYFKQYSTHFSDNLVKHFPIKSDSLYTFYFSTADTTDTTDLFKINRLMVCLSVRRDIILELKNKYLQEAYQVINANDTCALIVHRLNNENPELEDEFYRIVETYGNKDYAEKYINDTKETLKELENKCDSFTLPIPNFSSLKFNDKYLAKGNRLTDEFILYILDAKKGRFSEDDYLSKGYGLPEEWKNGYSKGVAINEKENLVLYWLEVW